VEVRGQHGPKIGGIDETCLIDMLPAGEGRGVERWKKEKRPAIADRVAPETYLSYCVVPTARTPAVLVGIAGPPAKKL